MDNVHWTVLNKWESNNIVGSAIIAQVYKKNSHFIFAVGCACAFPFFLFSFGQFMKYLQKEILFVLWILFGMR